MLVFALSLAVLAAALPAHRLYPSLNFLKGGRPFADFVAAVAAIMAVLQLLKLITQWTLSRRRRPLSEARMIGRLYDLLAALAIALALAHSFGKLGAFGAVFAAFGGMLLGWSLQAPVSGFAAWVLISLKRPFRPGDRIQLPSLGLTGDVKDVGLMYVMLDQVGGTIGSEEAVGRYILLPNAMLFSQVVINYTVRQESPYMLDEVVIRITYDSDWDKAERILLDAAREMTGDIIQATAVNPYIRSDMYDYGVYLRLRYMTRVKDRAEISYRITKRVFAAVQSTPSVDMAIPFVYSYRAAMANSPEDNGTGETKEVDLARLVAAEPAPPADEKEIEELAASIRRHGFLQPIVVTEEAPGLYRILAGHARVEACRRLGWKTVPAVIRGRTAGSKTTA